MKTIRNVYWLKALRKPLFLINVQVTSHTAEGTFNIINATSCKSSATVNTTNVAERTNQPNHATTLKSYH